MRTIPGMMVVNPSDAVAAKKLLRQIVEIEGPCYFRVGRAAVPVFYKEEDEITLGKGNLIREGKDVSIIATGIMVNEAYEAAKALADEGIDARVIDIHTIKPIDRETVTASARKTGAVLTVENHNVIGGLHSAVLEALEAEKIPALAVGIQDRFGEVGKLPYLTKALGLTKENVIETAKKAVSLK
jgi:transketolase